MARPGLGVQHANDFLKPQLMEATKEYISYDGTGRMEYVYTAHIDTSNGQSCMVTQYTYTTPTSNKIQKRKEFIGTWITATMDI